MEIIMGLLGLVVFCGVAYLGYKKLVLKQEVVPVKKKK